MPSLLQTVAEIKTADSEVAVTKDRHYDPRSDQEYETVSIYERPAGVESWCAGQHLRVVMDLADAVAMAKAILAAVEESEYVDRQYQLRLDYAAVFDDAMERMWMDRIRTGQY